METNEIIVFVAALSSPVQQSAASESCGRGAVRARARDAGTKGQSHENAFKQRTGMEAREGEFGGAAGFHLYPLASKSDPNG